MFFAGLKTKCGNLEMKKVGVEISFDGATEVRSRVRRGVLSLSVVLQMLT